MMALASEEMGSAMQHSSRTADRDCNSNADAVDDGHRQPKYAVTARYRHLQLTGILPSISACEQ